MFEKVKIIRPKRSVFNLRYNNRTTQNIGEVVPSMAKLMMPGDTFKFGQVATVELQPMISPAKGDLWLESCAFFVPLDILAIDDEKSLLKFLYHSLITRKLYLFLNGIWIKLILIQTISL